MKVAGALLIYGLTFVVFHVAFVGADTPANCSYEEILGEWNFHIGEYGHDKTVNCTGFGNDSSMCVTLVLIL